MNNKSSTAGFQPITVAYFISSHGFGHAARTSALIEAIQKITPTVSFHLFTTVPEWFFKDSLTTHWTFHSIQSDVGLIQKTALQEDVNATLEALHGFIPFSIQGIAQLADEVKNLACQLVICDISPLGLAVARQAKLPSVLIENFTWDWIYGGYPAYSNDFRPFIDYLAQIFSSADLHIRATPFCEATPANLVTSPISRSPRAGRDETRASLGIPADQKAVLITMGGIPDRWNVEALRSKYPDIVFIIPGGADREIRVDNLLYLPRHHAYFHPDLVSASDAVIGKVGYSTISEVYWAGKPFAYVSRQDFRESAQLVEYIRATIPGIELTQSEFENGGWQSRVGELLKLPCVNRSGENGADQIANYLASEKLLNM